MTNAELKSMTTAQLHEKLAKLDNVIAKHPQKTMRAQAGGTKAVILNYMERLS